MRLVDVLAMLVVLGVLVASLMGLFKDDAPGGGDPVRERRPNPMEQDTTPPPILAQEPTVIIDVTEPKQDSVGTAFSLDSDGVWMTARHVIEDCSRVGIVADENRAVRVSEIWSHPSADLAILSNAIQRPALSLAQRHPEAGEIGYGVGFPQGEPGQVSGRLIGQTTSVSQGRMRLKEPVLVWAETARHPSFEGSLGGISGGPLLLNDGTVAGVLISEAPRRGRFHTAAPASLTPAVNAAEIEADWGDEAYEFAAPLSAGSFQSEGNRLRDQGAVSLVICLVD